MPELRTELFPVWSAFTDLNPTRQTGLGFGALLLSEIVTWLDLHGIIDGEKRRWFVKMLRAIDCEYLKRRAEKNGV